MKKFLFIRHGKTQNNLERRYIGDTEEPLCNAGICEAGELANNLPSISSLISGTALRCRQTAEILFPALKYTLCPLTEIDFGLFKGKNADDLKGDRDYEKWLESGCMSDIPSGDSVFNFKEKCCGIFEQIAEKSSFETTTALVIHGGNIMAILEKFANPKQDFYKYHIHNCEYVLCRYESGTLYIERKGGLS